MENTSSAKKPYFETSDIMERYHVGRAQALKIMREIKFYTAKWISGKKRGERGRNHDSNNIALKCNSSANYIDVIEFLSLIYQRRILRVFCL